MSWGGRWGGEVRLEEENSRDGEELRREVWGGKVWKNKGLTGREGGKEWRNIRETTGEKRLDLGS